MSLTPLPVVQITTLSVVLAPNCIPITITGYQGGVYRGVRASRMRVET